MEYVSGCYLRNHEIELTRTLPLLSLCITKPYSFGFKSEKLRQTRTRARAYIHTHTYIYIYVYIKACASIHINIVLVYIHKSAASALNHRINMWPDRGEYMKMLNAHEDRHEFRHNMRAYVELCCASLQGKRTWNEEKEREREMIKIEWFNSLLGVEHCDAMERNTCLVILLNQ